MKVRRGLLVGIVLLSYPTGSHAFQLATSVGALQLPNSTYHLMSLDLQTSFSITEKSSIVLQLGMTPPFVAHGFSEVIPYTSLSWSWSGNSSGFRFFGGAGAGVYADLVNGKGYILPSLALNGGIRFGSKHFGGQFSMMAYLGIGPLSQFLNASVAWPLYNFLGGIYVGI